MVKVQQLLNINDFNNLDEAALIEIAENAGQKEYKKSQRLLADELKDCEIYLLDGEIEIQSDGGVNMSFAGGSERAQHPVFRVHTPGLYGRCLTPCKVLYINKSYFKKYNIHKSLGNADEIAVEELDTISGVDMKMSFVSEVLDAFKGDKVKIPSLPEIALHIRREIEKEEISAKKLAGLIQTDPAIAARVVQVSNSAIYGGGVQVNSIQSAITKIGFKAINDVVLCVVMRELFNPKSALIKKYMARFYEQSIRVGVICYDLAKHIKGMDPDHGFLVGLLHDIGTIPILVIADEHPDLSRQAGHLDATLTQLKSHIGSILLKQWQFGDEYAYIAQHASDWQRQTNEADYCDLVQVAILHAQFVGGPKCDAPVLSEVPAFQRLKLGEIDLAQNIRLLKDVNTRITDMIDMLCK